ncbi:MAG: hypothetical protein ACO1OB_07220, partial [Archangium sp.]
EYVIWRAFTDAKFEGVLEHINPDSESAQYSDTNFKPCLVISETPDARLAESWSSASFPLKDRFDGSGVRVNIYFEPFLKYEPLPEPEAQP